MKKIMLPLSICLLSAHAFAETKVGQVSIDPFVGYTVPDSKRIINDGITYGLNAEYRATANWAGQVFFNQSGTEIEGDPTQSDDHYDYKKYGFNALYYFSPEAKVQPYIVAGAGNAEHENDNETLLNLGGGVRYFVTDAFSINGGLLASHSADDDLDDGLASLGVAYSFGGKKEEPVVAAAPAPEPAPAPAPVDSDNDGVTDDKDKCPGTPAGTRVDSYGCVPKKLTIESVKLNIQFETAKDVITETYQPEVKKVADFLSKYDDVVVDIEGHTDAQGSDQYNQALSQRRADSVKKELVTRYNIAANRVKAVGYGEAKPVASNDNASGRAQNRRVVAVMQKEIMK